MIVPRFLKKITLFLLVGTEWAVAQNKATSPEATVQNRVQDIPVSLYTGNPVITVPLYTFQEGAISIPIGLSYNASGLRGNEVAPWTGLGWTLNAGGMITRLVRGWPDEGLPEGVQGPLRKGYYEVRNSANQDDDHEPDLFIANLNGATFKFCFNEKGVIHFFPQADLKVRPITKRNRYDNRVAAFSGWEVTGVDGTKYYFGSQAADNSDEYEYTITKDAKDPAPGDDDKKKASPSTWYLRRVETPYGQSVTIQYARIFYSYLQLGDSEWDSGSNPLPLKVNRVYVAGYIPKLIQGINSTVVFNKDYLYTTSYFNPETNDWEETINSADPGAIVRGDIMSWQGRTGTYSRILKNLVVRSGGQEQELRYTFYYDYFSGNYDQAGNVLPSGYSAGDVGNTHLKRLKLTSLTFPDGTNANFNYFYETSPFPGTLARGIDHWGYLNGNHGATHLIGQGECQGAQPWTPVNRTPTLDWNLYGTLQKITYSSGSETELTYENHVARNYGAVGGLRVRRIATRDAVTGQYSIREYEYTLFDSPTSSGFLHVKPVYRFDYPNNGGYGFNSYLYPLAIAISGRPVVGYRNVKETAYGGSINLGQFNSDGGYRNSFKLKSTKYTFDQQENEANICDGDQAYSRKPWWYRPFYDYQGGNMLRVEERAKNDALAMVKEMEYDQSAIITTYNANRAIYYNNKLGYEGGANYTQAFLRYSLKKETSYAYDQNGSNYVRTEAEYTYKDKMEQDFKNRYPGVHTMPTLVRTLDAQGTNVYKYSLYAADFDFGTSTVQVQYQDYNEVTGQLVGSGYYEQIVENVPGPDEPKAIYNLKQKNMDVALVETYTVRNQQVLSSLRNQYEVGTGRLKFSYRLRYFPFAENSFVSARWQNGNWQTDTRYQLISTIDEYNSVGLPTNVKVAFGPRTRTDYVGYGGLLPTKVTQNADNSDSQETKYTYDVPMFGVTRQEAPNNFATTQEYENGTGRLRQVKNQNGHVLRHYEYKARGQ